MLKISFAEFKAKQAKADRVCVEKHTHGNNRTRQGVYVNLYIGLTFEQWFVGIDLTVDEQGNFNPPFAELVG